MEQQRNSDNNERMNQPDQSQGQQGGDNINTASGLRDELKRDQSEAGSGRSYDYGAEGSTEEDLNEQLGRNSNQQNVSNPVNTPGTSGGSTMGSHSSDS
ncbi:MAG TPA: hypothetical protein VM010_06685, partial [Chitinophagaceae bacterium]|nr:hypothetical protein [Chitinophagaceae bacterium]